MLIKIRQTEEFAAWLNDLRDLQAAARINVRVRRLSQEHDPEKLQTFPIRSCVETKRYGRASIQSERITL